MSFLVKDILSKMCCSMGYLEVILLFYVIIMKLLKYINKQGKWT
jgi:hypothetical protein